MAPIVIAHRRSYKPKSPYVGFTMVDKRVDLQLPGCDFHGSDSTRSRFIHGERWTLDDLEVNLMITRYQSEISVKDRQPGPGAPVGAWGRVLLALLLGVVVGGAATGTVMSRTRDSSVRSANVVVTSVRVGHGYPDTAIICFDSAPFGDAYDEKCGRAYATSGMVIDQGLLGRSVQVTKMGVRREGLDVFLINQTL